MQRKKQLLPPRKKFKHLLFLTISFFVPLRYAKRKQTTIENLFQRFANKYTFVGLLFVIWIALFDKYSFIDRLQLYTKINQLESEKEYYREKIEEDKRKKEELLGNRVTWRNLQGNSI